MTECIRVQCSVQGRVVFTDFGISSSVVCFWVGGPTVVFYVQGPGESSSGRGHRDRRSEGSPKSGRVILSPGMMTFVVGLCRCTIVGPDSVSSLGRFCLRSVWVTVRPGTPGGRSGRECFGVRSSGCLVITLSSWVTVRFGVPFSEV